MNPTIDMDPLNTYEYPCGYGAVPIEFTYNVKMEPQYNPAYHYPQQMLNPNHMINEPNIEHKSIAENTMMSNRSVSDSKSVTSDSVPNSVTSTVPSKTTTNPNNGVTSAVPNKSTTSDAIESNTLETVQNLLEDTKEHLKSLLQKNKKKKGKVSSFWNKKIEDKDFAFYGCTICNISFKNITELDTHVTIHKGRVTSYDLRIKNQKKKKMLKKEQKRMKKISKVKTEDVKKEIEIEIKPEDGYIGTEAASEYGKKTDDITETQKQNLDNTKNNGDAEKSNGDGSQETTSNNKENSSKNKKGKSKEDVNDPRLEKLFKCFACQKQFALSYYLKLHVRSHTDERPYTCAECGMSFITASKLGRHTKRIHLSVRYTCRICYRYFSRFEYLTRHFDKKHPDDKIEGEPYDYNIILPYLKELEEELREKAESKDSKLKTEDEPAKDNVDEQEKSSIELPKIPPIEEKDSKSIITPILSDDTKDKLIVTNIKEEPSDPVEPMKQEEVYYEIGLEVCKNEDESDHEKPPEDDFVRDADADAFQDFDDDACKNDGKSEEDYFPSNTWVANPLQETAPVAVKPRRRGRKKIAKCPLQCDLCNKLFTTRYYMKIHMRTHTGERPYKCNQCSKSFLTSGKLKRHLLTHVDDMSDEKPKSEDQIKTENGDCSPSEGKKIKKKSKKKKKKKKIADVDAKEIQGFKVRGDFTKRPFVCMYCHQRFLHKDTMILHRRTHKDETLKCYFCLSPMPDEESLTAHEETHTGPKPYLCNVCGRNYRRREAMLTHKKVHDPAKVEGKEKKEFICDVCSKSYNAACKLQRHLVSHRGDKYVLKYECPVCAHMFNTKYHIQMHLSTHMKEGLIVQENRNEILAMVLQNARKIPKTSDSGLSLTELMPPDERSRVCNICGQVFQHFYYLEEHLKSHGSKIAIEDDNQIEERKHICHVCNKGFKLHYYLKLHLFTHTKEKPFICNQCGKGFITKGKLKRHMETHTGLKKYQCHICCKFFTRPSYLRIHVRTIHGTQDYNFSLGKYDMPMN